jgi:hypothetical protein
MSRYEGVEVWFHVFLILAADGVKGQFHTPTGEEPPTPTGAWVSPRVVLDAVEKRTGSCPGGN